MAITNYSSSRINIYNSMKAKEKAQELVEKMIIASDEESARIGKNCALICVDEILSQEHLKNRKLYSDFKDFGYWRDVKKEIEKL